MVSREKNCKSMIGYVADESAVVDFTSVPRPHLQQLADRYQSLSPSWRPLALTLSQPPSWPVALSPLISSQSIIGLMQLSGSHPIQVGIESECLQTQSRAKTHPVSSSLSSPRCGLPAVSLGCPTVSPEGFELGSKWIPRFKVYNFIRPPDLWIPLIKLVTTANPQSKSHIFHPHPNC